MTPVGWLLVVLALLVGAVGGYLLGRRAGRSGPAEAPAVPAASGLPLAGAFPLGLVAGVVFVGLVGGLLLWLAPGRPGSRRESPVHPPAASVAPAPLAGGLEAAIAERDRQILANPEDLEARREMALMLLSADRLMDALEQADQILSRQPGDATALYVQGVVRLEMGQRERGWSLLEQALESDPAHVHALIAVGRLHLQDGRRAEALSVLRTALEAAGGRHPGIERMIAEAEGGLG